MSPAYSSLWEDEGKPLTSDFRPQSFPPPVSAGWNSKGSGGKEGHALSCGDPDTLKTPRNLAEGPRGEGEGSGFLRVLGEPFLL